MRVAPEYGGAILRGWLDWTTGEALDPKERIQA